MARTPLFGRLRTLLRAAQFDDSTVAFAPHSTGRRRFMQAAAVGGAAIAAASCTTTQEPAPPPKPKANQPRIAIIGAGVAGLNCAYQLRKQNVMATVFEAGTRVGGRMLSKTDLLGTELVTELGGEFIDSGHEDMLNLCKEFGLELLDMQADTGVTECAYYFATHHYKDAEVFAALKPLVSRINEDAKLCEYEPVRGRGDAAYRRLDETPLRDYLDAIGCSGWLRSLIDVAFVTEYGLDTGEQSSMNMLSMLSTEPGPDFEPFGESDERYKVKGGNELVCTKLAERIEGSIKLEGRLARITGPKPYKLTFDTPRKVKEETFDIVVLALPFTILRDIDIRLELPAEKTRAIRQLGYGKNAKLLVGLDTRPWRLGTFGGGIFSDEPYQLAWDNSRMQWGAGAKPVQGPAGLTFFSGGSMCDAMNMGTPKQQVERLLPRLDLAFPGVKKAFTEKLLRMHWPSDPRVLGSYSAYRPGQWSTIRGHESTPVGELFFAGEHCSLDSQGYMNGGAQTGRVAAEQVMAKLPK